MAPKLTSKEIKFVLLVSLILIVITSIPFIYGYLIKGSSFYNGLHVFSPADGSVYYSFIWQVKDGHYLMSDLFSNEVNSPNLFNPFWLGAGLVARIFNFSPFITFFLLRLILIPLFLFVLYKIISFFLNQFEERLRKFAFLYSIFATGVSAIVFFFWPKLLRGGWPIDLWVPESSNFLIIFNSPHFIASITLILLTFYYLFLALEEKKIRLSLMAGLLALVLFSFHPFFVTTIYAVSFVYVIFLNIKNKKFDLAIFKNYFIFVLVSLPSVLYYLYLLSANISLKIKAWQNTCYTPGGISFFISYGLGLFFAIFAIVYLLNKKNLTNKNLFLIIWFVVSIILIYGPFNFQRRLTEGFQVPLTILSFMGLIAVYNFLKIRWPGLKNFMSWGLLVPFVFLFCLSNVIIYAFDFKYLATKPDNIFINQDIKNAAEWYRSQTSIKETILASAEVGNIIPGLVGRRVFIGHGVETINFNNKGQQMLWFFKTNTDDLAKKEFLQNNHLDYIFYAAKEKELGDFFPQKKDYLKSVYKNNSVEIFKFIPD